MVGKESRIIAWNEGMSNGVPEFLQFKRSFDFLRHSHAVVGPLSGTLLGPSEHSSKAALQYRLQGVGAVDFKDSERWQLG